MTEFSFLLSIHIIQTHFLFLHSLESFSLILQQIICCHQISHLCKHPLAPNCSQHLENQSIFPDKKLPHLGSYINSRIFGWKCGKMVRICRNIKKHLKTIHVNYDLTVHELFLGASIYFHKFSKFFHIFNLVTDSCPLTRITYTFSKGQGSSQLSFSDWEAQGFQGFLTSLFVI